LAARAAANVATPTSAPDERGEFAGRRVLLVEDNDASQRAAAWMLEKMGCAADVAADGGEAITKAAAGEYDAILMDVQMPVMDGYAATAAIRRGQRGPRRTPIIAMTANAMAGDRERCLAGGMDDYVSKPIVKAELRAGLGKWFGPQSAGARETTAGGPATFNREAALSRFDGDAEVLGQLAGLFLREAAARTPKIAQAIAAGEWPTALRLAHTTKGGASYVGADAAQQAAAELEAAARAADLAAAQRWLAALQARLREFADATTTLTMST
jgi:CheY-like chemotaxis protein